jgi:hypothetical protein
LLLLESLCAPQKSACRRWLGLMGISSNCISIGVSLCKWAESHSRH